MICISGCNLNSIKSSNLQSQLQHSLYLNKDIQCYSKNNANFMNSKVQQQFHEGAKRSYQFSKSTWGISQAISDSDFKAEGTGIVTRASCSTRVKKEERDKLGRWTYQILDGKGERNVLIMSVYQWCTFKNKNENIPAVKLQQLLLNKMNRKDIDPTKNFCKDIMALIVNLRDKNNKLIPIIIRDRSKECKGSSTSNQLCNEFGLGDIFDHLYPNQKQFKTYIRGSSQIDFALARERL